ncbi:hypothetical protein OQA88_4361 [Cercophora sp. LCS_1]
MAPFLRHLASALSPDDDFTTDHDEMALGNPTFNFIYAPGSADKHFAIVVRCDANSIITTITKDRSDEAAAGRIVDAMKPMAEKRASERLVGMTILGGLAGLFI